MSTVWFVRHRTHFLMHYNSIWSELSFCDIIKEELGGRSQELASDTQAVVSANGLADLAAIKMTINRSR